MKFAWLCSHESYQPEALVEQAVLADGVGFDMVLGSDHFHPWVDDESAAGPLFHYHPALIAQAAATVDRVSGGRFTLGLGTGENIDEGPLGFAFPGYKERIERLDEALESSGEKSTSVGSTTRCRRRSCTVRR